MKFILSIKYLYRSIGNHDFKNVIKHVQKIAED